MNAQKWLYEIKKLDELIDAKQAERDRLKDIASNISARPIDGMPRNKDGMRPNKFEDAMISLLLYDHELNKLVDKYIDRKQEVVSILEKLPEKEYGVLHRRYIRYMTWDEIADDMCYCTRQIVRIHKRALQMLNDVIECHNEM